MDSVGDEALDIALCRITIERPAYGLNNYLRSLYRDNKTLYDILTARLFMRGILKIEIARVLWVFRRDVYPAINPKPEEEIDVRIRSAILEDGGNVDERTAILISIINGCGGMYIVMSKGEIRKYGKRIKEICDSTATCAYINKALAGVIAEDQASMNTIFMSGLLSS